MSVLKIQILGSPHLQHGDQVIQIKRQTPRAILYYLAATPEVLAREKLLDLFWPNQNPEQSRTRLREALSRLRTSIPNPSLIQSTPEALWLDKNFCEVDLDLYLRLLEEASPAAWAVSERTPLPPRLAFTLNQAASLWKGHFLLEGARLPSTPAFDEWLTTTNAQLVEQQVRVLRRLAAHAIVSGNPVQATEYLQNALEFDELDETLAYQLIQLRLESGQIHLAQKTYREFAARLMRELGTAPGTQLAALYRRLENPATVPKPHPEATLNLHLTLELPFVGRTNVFGMLERALQSGGIFYLHGPAGSGKSRLIQEFARLKGGGHRFLVARCRSNDNLIPLQMLIDALRTQIQSDEWGVLPAPWLEYLSIWLPELQARLAEPPRLPEINQQRAVQEALRQLLLALHNDYKLIFVIDDIHWCDEASINTLAYLFDRSPFDAGALMVLSGRGDYPNPDLDAWLSNLQPDIQSCMAELSGLTSSETLDLCQAAFQTTISPDFADQLHAKTAGNPYFILETIRNMLENNLIPSVYLPDIPTPPTISALLHTRIRQVSLLGGKYLTVAAVFGREFNPADVSEVCEFSPIQTARVLEELEKRALIEPHPTNQDRYQFTHDTLVEAALDNLYPARRAALHGLALRLLEQRHASDLGPVAALLAGHAEQARLGPQAFEYWLLAGKNAWRMFLLDETFTAFQRADHLINDYPGQIKVDQIHRLYSEWNDAAFEANDPEKLLALNERLLDLGERFQSLLLTGAALNGLTDASMALNRFDEGLKYSEQAVQVLQDSSDRIEYIEAQLHKGVIYYMLNRMPESEATFDSLFRLVSGHAGDVKTLQTLSNIHYQTALVKVLRAKPALGWFHGLAALELSKQSNYHHNQIDAHTVLTFAAHFSGNYALALQHAEAGLKMAGKLHASRMLGYLYVMHAMTQLLCGRIDESIAACTAARRLGEEFGQYETISLSYRLEGDVYAFLQIWDKARDAFQYGVEAGQEGFWVLDNLFRLGYVYVQLGHVESGLQQIQKAIDLAEEAGIGLIEHIARVVLSHLYIQTGQMENAELCATQTLQATQRACVPALRIGSQETIGFCAAAKGRSDVASEHFRQAYQLANRLGDHWLEISVIAHIRASAQFLDVLPYPDQFLENRLNTLQNQLINSTTNPEFRRALQMQMG